MPQSQMTGIIRFGNFEVEPQTGVLRKHGIRVRLQEQPFRVLLALLEKPGAVVTREELRERLWAGASFGDFDHSLNIAVNKIREALGDTADHPRFVETLPRRGYRFIAPVEGGVAPVAPSPVPARSAARIPRWTWLAGAGLGVVAVVAGIAAWLSPSAPPRLEWRRLTNDNSAKISPVLSDGARLYFRTGNMVAASGRLQILQVPVSGGEPTRVLITVPPEPSYQVLDLSPDGQEMLLVACEWGWTDFELRYDVRYPLEAGPLWNLRLADGSSRRVGSLLAREARFSPDGKQIAFTSGGLRLWSGGLQAPSSLWVASSDGSNVRRLLESKDLDIVVPCWSADGRRIAFGQSDRATQERSAWEVAVDGTRLRRLLPDFHRNHLPAGWTPDGGLLLISEGHFWIGQPRRFFQFKQPPPIQLSTGDPLFAIPVQLQRSRRFYSVGLTRLGELQRFDTRSGKWEPHLGGISADNIVYSRNGQSLAYTTHPELELWVRRADGSRPVQLTKAPMQAAVARWSPDGRIIAFAGRRTPDQPWTIYLVDAMGGNLRPACPKACTGFDLAWMPDGKKLVFAAPISIFATEAVYLRILDLATGEVTRFPGSEGLHSPRMSPDGSTLAALVSARGGELALYYFSERVWKKLPHPGPGQPDWPSWSSDGQSIWYCNLQRDAIMRVHVRENRHEEMSSLRLDEMTGVLGSWFNLTPEDEPMILRRRDVQQIYALELTLQ